MAYRTVNPYNNEVVATFDDLTDAEAMNLLAQAQKTFESWSQMSYAERAAVCRRAAAILTERPDEFARLLTLEMGKLYTESLGEVALAADIFTYYADNAEAFLAPERLNTVSDDDDAMLVTRPARGDPGDTAVELPALPAGPGRGAQPDGRQRGHGQARLQRAAGGGRLRAAAGRSRCP